MRVNKSFKGTVGGIAGGTLSNIYRVEIDYITHNGILNTVG